MIKKIVLGWLLVLLIALSIGVPKSNAMMMKNPCGVNANNGKMMGKAKNMMISKSVMMKMKKWMPAMMSYAPQLGIMPFFFNVFPGAHLIFNNRKILRLTPLQVKQEAMLVKKMEDEAIPQFKILNKTKKAFYMEVNKNNPSTSKLISYDKAYGNAEISLAKAMISAHMKATSLLTPSQKSLLRKMLINWPVVNVVYP